MIGKFDVPSAINLEPLDTNKAVAFEPAPACPLIIVPGSIVSVAPFVIAILPANS
jgi:hypothetical protein